MIPHLDENRVETALRRLSETGEEFAELNARAKLREKIEKTVLAAEFLEADGTVAEREAKARMSKKYTEWTDDYKQIILKLELLKVKRAQEELVIECWRTESANSRKGIL